MDAGYSTGVKVSLSWPLLRAMRPYTYHQDELNEAVVKVLDSLAVRIDPVTWALEVQTGLDATGRQRCRA